MFCQSNFGVVTQMGLWLMPAPETMLALDYEFDQPEDLGWVVDTLAPLRREGVIQQSPSIGNWLRAAAVMTTRNQWSDQPGQLPESAITAIRKRFGIGSRLLLWIDVEWKFRNVECEVVNGNV